MIHVSMLKSAGITKQIETTLITATSQMFSFACSFAFAFLPARVGRRPLMLTSMAGMWVVFAVITATSGAYVETGNRHASYTTVAFIYLYSGVHNLGWTGAQMLYSRSKPSAPKGRLAFETLTRRVPSSCRNPSLHHPRQGHGHVFSCRGYLWSF